MKIGVMRIGGRVLFTKRNHSSSNAAILDSFLIQHFVESGNEVTIFDRPHKTEKACLESKNVSQGWEPWMDKLKFDWDCTTIPADIKVVIIQQGSENLRIKTTALPKEGTDVANNIWVYRRLRDWSGVVCPIQYDAYTPFPAFPDGLGFDFVVLGCNTMELHRNKKIVPIVCGSIEESEVRRLLSDSFSGYNIPLVKVNVVDLHYMLIPLIRNGFPSLSETELQQLRSKPRSKKIVYIGADRQDGDRSDRIKAFLHAFRSENFDVGLYGKWKWLEGDEPSTLNYHGYLKDYLDVYRIYHDAWGALAIPSDRYAKFNQVTLRTFEMMFCGVLPIIEESWAPALGKLLGAQNVAKVTVSYKKVGKTVVPDISKILAISDLERDQIVTDMKSFVLDFHGDFKWSIIDDIIERALSESMEDSLPVLKQYIKEMMARHKEKSDKGFIRYQKMYNSYVEHFEKSDENLVFKKSRKELLNDVELFFRGGLTIEEMEKYFI